MRRPSLGQVFALVTALVAVVVFVAFSIFRARSRGTIAEAAMRLRAAAALRVQTKVTAELGRAQRALDVVDSAIVAGAIDVANPGALERPLFTEMLGDPHLEEVTFTRATWISDAPDGEAMLAPEGKFQLSVYREEDGRLQTRVTEQEGGTFVVSERDRAVGGGFESAPLIRVGKGSDPTLHPTFSVIARKAGRGRALWSDLHESELDPDAVIVSVQKSISDRSGKFLGVVRVGLLTRELDAIARWKVDEGDPNDPHRIVLLSVSGKGEGARLVARVDPSDRVQAFGDDLRVVSDRMPPEVAALLVSPIVASLDAGHPNADGTFDVGGERYAATLREIVGAQGGTVGWFVAVLVPEAHDTRELAAAERGFLGVFALTLAIVVALGALTLAAVRRGLRTMVAHTERMRRFDFAPSGDRSVFRDVDDVMQGLERAKTVARAMGKYIPLDLVRALYESNKDPELGGALADVSLMFTDIEGFTTLAEKLSPVELAQRLGDYLQAMTEAIESTSGTIDKYIGDAVMAFWNAPTTTPDHEQRACRAALACMKATAALYASPSWKGLPSLVTRYGIHRARVMVGHFGAPSRLSYTALGDGVNLAARLEPLCKQYGVIALVSEDVVAAAKGAFRFRRIDRVAVKGKSTGVDVYELLGALDDAPSKKHEVARAYEAGLEAYLGREFDRAIELLSPCEVDDPPSAVLLRRCLAYRAEPPPPEWSGVHVAASK